jgi:hypothetical protein
MMKTALSSGVLALALVVIGGCANEETKVSGIVVSDDIVERLGQYSPTELTADLSGVPESELSVLVELIRAGKVMDEIFLRQVSSAPGIASTRWLLSSARRHIHRELATTRST